MKIHQISLFLENKPGHLNAICRTLAEAQINIVTLSLADTQQFGIVRLIVEEWQKAKDVLEQAGYVVNVREVVAATVPSGTMIGRLFAVALSFGTVTLAFRILTVITALLASCVAPMVPFPMVPAPPGAGS